MTVGPTDDNGAQATPAPNPQQTLAQAQSPDRSSVQPTYQPPNAAPSEVADPKTENMDVPGHNTRTWGERVYHGVLDALGGTDQVSYQRDPKTGQMIATAAKIGPGQQWKRIISGAIAGYAAAAATGAHGPGSTSAKIGAGFQAGEKIPQQRDKAARDQANEEYEYQLKAATSNAQNALLNHQIAESTFNLGRAQVNASVADTERENTFSQLVSQGGEASQDLGVFPDFNSVMKAFKENPALHDHQAGGRIIGIPHINAQGKVDGVHAALVTPDWLNSKINQDLPITVRSYKDGKLEESTFTIPAGSLTGDAYAKMVMSQSADALKEYGDKVKQDQEAEKLKIQKELSLSEEDKNYGEAALAKFNRGGGDAAALVDMIGQGKMNTGRLAYLMARNPTLLGAVADKYPGFDSTKVDQYLSAYKDFTSGPVSVQLNAGSTALRHMAELRAMNTDASHIPGTSDYNAYQNKADTLATELAKFYGDATIPAIAAIKDTLTATLPKNRDAGIRSQAQSMIDKFDEFHNQWKNAAPSAVYEAQMPKMSDEAMAAEAKLRGELKPQQSAGDLPADAAAKLQEGVNTAFGNGQVWTKKNGKPVQVK